MNSLLSVDKSFLHGGSYANGMREQKNGQIISSALKDYWIAQVVVSETGSKPATITVKGANAPVA